MRVQLGDLVPGDTFRTRLTRRKGEVRGRGRGGSVFGVDVRLVRHNLTESFTEVKECHVGVVVDLLERWEDRGDFNPFKRRRV